MKAGKDSHEFPTIERPQTVSSQQAEKANGRKRGMDVELQAMARLDRILAELSPPSIGRVLAWLNSRYDERCGDYQDKGPAEPFDPNV